jgi:hypothetical protein
VVREAVLPAHERDEQVLLQIARSGSRARASLALSGKGLALAGVGYCLDDNTSITGANMDEKVGHCA